MSDSPRVSVIMNCLNSSKHLREAIDSVMRQTFQDYEIIFWDNCSTDASPEIAKSYGEKVRYFRGETVVPLGAGRNLAIARARGEFIAFLDCDDLWEPEKLARQVALFDANPKVGLVTTDTAVFDGKRVLRRVFEGARPGRGMVFADLMLRQWISMSSAVLRRSALASLTGDGSWSGGWFDETLNVCEEADVFYRVAHDWELDYVDEPLTTWRVHGQNTTFRRFEQFAGEIRAILAKHERLYPGYAVEYAEVVSALRRRADFQEALALWQKGQGAEARRLVAPYGLGDRKMLAFRVLSYLPGSCFNMAAKVYFALPKIFAGR
ncbi:MAG: glycosyltransferase [Desulfovibrionaceae bacterium]|nr:glycosyltransferase [Desulfovibrionaceae bacterium]